MSRRPYLYVHADDYGMTPESCRRILECREKGCLNRISVLPNGCLEQAFQLDGARALPCAVHLNLVEGKALTPAEQIGLLAGPDGRFRHTFFGLLVLSLSPRRRRLETQLYAELRAQLLAVKPWLKPGEPAALDSHQHTHMIPLVFRTLLRAAKDCGVPVGYLRIPAEPLGPFLREPSLWPGIRPVNLVKNLLLRLLWQFNRGAFRRSGASSAVFCGILFSGNMREERVTRVLPHFIRLAEKRGSDLEFLFHPGFAEPGEAFLDPEKKGFCRFYLSAGRRAERAALQSEAWGELVRRVNNTAEDTECP